MRYVNRGIAIWLLVFSVMTHAQENDNGDAVVRGVCYVGLSVSDLEKAVEFYRDACDLKVVEEKRLSGIAVLDELAGRAGVEASSRMLEGKNAQIRLMQFEARSDLAKSTSPVPVEGPGLMHICFQVQQERQTYQRVLDAGATVIGSRELSQLNPRLEVFYAYVHDFDRRVVEVEHIGKADREGRAVPKKGPRVRHICISTPDIERLLAFYTAFLGKEPRRVGPISGERFDMVSGHPGTDITMAWYGIGKFELEVNQYLSHPTELRETPRPIDALGYNMVVYHVNDLQTASELVVAAGGTIITEPSSMDGGRVVFGRDPDGNLLGLMDVPDDAVASTVRFNDR